MRDSVKTIGGIIDKSGTAMIGSVDGEGFPNMKAMLPPRKREGISEFYFTTNTSSMRVKQYLENPKASIYFYDKRFLQRCDAERYDGSTYRFKVERRDLEGGRRNILSSGCDRF